MLLIHNSSDWNTHYQFYGHNKRSMLDFEGNMSEPSSRLMDQVVFEEEDDYMTNLASTMALVIASVWEASIKANGSTVFSTQLSVDKYSSLCSDFVFFNAMNLR